MDFKIKSESLLVIFLLCCFFGAGIVAVKEKPDKGSQVEPQLISSAEMPIQDTPSNVLQPENNSVLRNLQTARPDLEFTVLGMSPIPGVYEVQVKNGPVLFVHEAGQYLLQGDLLQVRTNGIVSLKEEREMNKRREIFSKRSAEDMIIFKPEGESKAIMNVFTDVDCGYCRKFHREVPQLNAMGIEVRYLAFPRAGIPSVSYDKIAKAWCAKDQQSTLTKVKSGQKVDAKVCDDNPIAEHYAFGNRIGVTGTPAIILMDGTLIPGYQSAANFAELLGVTP